MSALPTFNSGMQKTNIPNTAEGFTLLEMLLVIVIIAVVSGVAMLSLGDRRLHSLKAEGQKLQATLNWLSEEAVFQQRPYGLQILEQGYQQLVWDYGAEQWSVAMINTPSIYLPDYISINPQPEKTQEQRQALSDGIEPSPVPGIVFYPDGNLEYFELTLRLTDSDQWLAIRGRRFQGIELDF